MPVTLKLSDEEARDLAEMLSTAATVAASNQQDGAEARLAAWGNLVSRLMKELSVTSKLKGRIAYADELGGYAFTREYEESAFFQDCLDEYRDNSFWADLVTRMADKAISEHLGPEYFENMPEDERRRTAEALENPCGRNAPDTALTGWASSCLRQTDKEKNRLKILWTGAARMIRARFACISPENTGLCCLSAGKYSLISALFQVSGRHALSLDAAR